MISACLRKQAAREEGTRLLALLIFPNMPIMIAGTYFRGCKIGLRSAPNSPIVNAIVQRGWIRILELLTPLMTV
jgi:hypothetical protein